LKFQAAGCAMLPPDSADAPFPAHIAGEQAPAWLPAGLALSGIALAIASVWLGLSAQPGQIPGVWNEDFIDQRPLHSPVAATRAGDAELRSRTAPGGSVAPEKPANTERTILPPPSMATRPGETPLDQPPRATDAPARTEPAPLDCAPVVSVPFDRDSVVPAVAVVSSELRALAGYLERHPHAKLSVEGHADGSGAENHNLLLSYRRAKALLPALASVGVAESRVVLGAIGANALVDGLPANSPENRRVVLQVRDSACPAGQAAGGLR
jgi:outer membrane protein OmpA-like peptidoglycan-associated protein